MSPSASRSNTESTGRAVLLGVVAVGLIAGLVHFSGLGDVDPWGGGDPETQSNEARVELLVPYDSEFIDVWVQGCVGSGETADFCRCAIDTYTARLRPDEFETASAVALSGGDVSELPKNVRDAVETVERDCR